MRVEQLPFTVYDILGYLAPGVFWLWLILATASYSGLPVDQLREFALVTEGIFGKILTSIAFLFASFVLGHLISFLSSLTIEEFAKLYLGYPSFYIAREYNLKKNKQKYSVYINALNSLEKQPFWFILISILCIPLTFLLLVFGWCNWFGKIVKGLSPTIIDMLDRIFPVVIQLRCGKPTNIEWAKHKNSSDDIDWFRFVAFEVANNNQTALSRMYNYLTIYGFLRSTCFSTITFGYVGVIAFFYINDIIYLYISGTLIVLSFFLFLSYSKFHRRYTEEAILAFVTFHQFRDIK